MILNVLSLISIIIIITSALLMLISLRMECREFFRIIRKFAGIHRAMPEARARFQKGG
jgi:hypothetical protein